MLAAQTSEYIGGNAEMSFSLEQCQHLVTFQQGQIQVVDDIEVLASPAPLECFLGSLGLRSYVAIPLQTQDSLIGVLLLGTERRGHWQAENIEVASEVARSLALAIQQARLRQNLESQAIRLEASLREKELLLQEIHHRVKNNLQVTSSLLRLQSIKVEDPSTLNVLQESQNRIRSMALIHEKLYQSKDLSRVDFAAYISDLAHYLFGAYRSTAGQVKLNLDVRDVALEIDTAIPCGLIINELVSNALKHAFPEGRRGEIFVTLGKTNGRYSLTVHDDGIGMPPDLDLSKVDSLGVLLITTLVDQLEGTLEWSRNGGTTATIAFGHP
jgi:two-component sensor histidine kinase